MTESPAVFVRAPRAAAAMLGIEAAALAVLAVWQVIELIVAETMSIATALALIAMTALGAVALGAFAAGVLAGRTWARSGGIVAQVLIFAVAVGSVTGPYPHWGIAAALAVPALVTAILLFSSPPRAESAAPSER